MCTGGKVVTIVLEFFDGTGSKAMGAYPEVGMITRTVRLM